MRGKIFHITTSSRWGDGPERLHSERPFCVEIVLRSYKKTRSEATLLLDINFFEEEISVALGKLRVGINRGRLTLSLVNGRMPLAKRGMLTEFPLQVTVKINKNNTSKYSRTEEAMLRGDVSILNNPGVTAGTSNKLGSVEESTSIATEEYSYNKVYVSAGGFESHPFWDFRAITQHESLYGGRFDEKLGKVVITDRLCSVDAVFKTASRNLLISGAEGIWPSDMTNNNRAIRRLVIWKWLSRVHRHLCSAHLEL